MADDHDWPRLFEVATTREQVGYWQEYIKIRVDKAIAEGYGQLVAPLSEEEKCDTVRLLTPSESDALDLGESMPTTLPSTG